MFHLSEPIHKLQVELRKANEAKTPLEFDVVVIGSGYGGAVAAARFAQAGLTVLVLERGKEYVPGEFPNNLSEAPSHVRIEFNNEAKPWGYEEALFDIRIGGETATILATAWVVVARSMRMWRWSPTHQFSIRTGQRRSPKMRKTATSVLTLTGFAVSSVSLH